MSLGSEVISKKHVLGRGIQRDSKIWIRTDKKLGDSLFFFEKSAVAETLFPPVLFVLLCGGHIENYAKKKISKKETNLLFKNYQKF